jgi:hypothetical protein
LTATRFLLEGLAATTGMALLMGCGTPEPPTPPPEVAFRCHLLLIGSDTQSCVEDVQGPGTLEIRFKPDPPQGGWELALTGLAPLADACGFIGSYDQKRLSALQGRGETEIVCKLAPGIDRSYHELTFESRLDAANTSMGIEVTFSR